ncbi:MAG: hypothetical protein IT200_04995 [Thermoleophilia bacterium]|nr:hypothetical protein [Thermoleophilia bacterium]
MDTGRPGEYVADPAREAPPAPEAHTHDVVDLDTGRVASADVRRAPAAATLAGRLEELGVRVDAALVAKRTHRLTPQRPYQATPQAWLDTFDGAYTSAPGVNQIWWRMPASFPTEFMAGVNFSFRGSGAGPRLLRLTYEVWPYAGMTGTVVVDIGAKRTEIPISASGTRTTDIAFTHPGGVVDARVFFRPGLIDFVFKAVALSRRA